MPDFTLTLSSQRQDGSAPDVLGPNHPAYVLFVAATRKALDVSVHTASTAALEGYTFRTLVGHTTAFSARLGSSVAAHAAIASEALHLPAVWELTQSIAQPVITRARWATTRVMWAVDTVGRTNVILSGVFLLLGTDAGNRVLGRSLAVVGKVAGFVGRQVDRVLDLVERIMPSFVSRWIVRSRQFVADRATDVVEFAARTVTRPKVMTAILRTRSALGFAGKSLAIISLGNLLTAWWNPAALVLPLASAAIYVARHGSARGWFAFGPKARRAAAAAKAAATAATEGARATADAAEQKFYEVSRDAIDAVTGNISFGAKYQSEATGERVLRDAAKIVEKFKDVLVAIDYVGRTIAYTTPVERGVAYVAEVVEHVRRHTATKTIYVTHDDSVIECTGLREFSNGRLQQPANA